jgi:hypothetical protein
MTIVALTLGLFLVLALIVAGLVRSFQDHSVRELLDWKPTRSPEVEAQNEVDDVRQMIEAQNEYRRKRGAKEITEADVQRQAAEDQQLRARGVGPFKQAPDVVDELDAGPKKLRPPKNPKPRAKRKAKAKPKPKRS